MSNQRNTGRNPLRRVTGIHPNNLEIEMSNVMDTIHSGCKDFYFGWLSEVRDQGSINMFAAPSIMAEEFDLTLKQATQITAAWMESFEENQQ